MRAITMTTVLLLASMSSAHAGRGGPKPGTISASKRAAARLNKSPRIKAAAINLLERRGVAFQIWDDAHPGQPTRDGGGAAILKLRFIGHAADGYRTRKLKVRVKVGEFSGGEPVAGGPRVSRDVLIKGNALRELRQLLKEQPRVPRERKERSKPIRVE